jgi:hypothetical protein
MMPTLEQINPTTYKIDNGRDTLEIGDINAVDALGHLFYKRPNSASSFKLSKGGTPSGLMMVDMTNGIVTIPYGDKKVEITAHEPDNKFPDGRGEFNVIYDSKPTPDANGEYWEVLEFESDGLTWDRVLGLDEEWSQQSCYDHWYADLHDNHEGNDLYGHDNGTGIFVRTPTEIRSPDGQVVIKSKPEHLVHSLIGTSIANTHRKHNLGKIKANTPNKGKDLLYTTVSRDHALLPRRELVDKNGNRARIEDIELVGNQIIFKLPKAFIDSLKKKDYPIRHITGVDPAYTEDMDTFGTGLTEGAWTDYDIYTNKGTPKNSVVEIIITNDDGGKEYFGGIRTDGSGLNSRYTQLHEAEGGGATAVRMFALVDASTGLIEYYTQENTDIIFTIVGYWENVGFTELGGVDAAGATEDAWTEVQLSDSGAANRVCHFVCSSNTADVATTVGVRNTASSTNRYVLVHEPEAGGRSQVDMLTKADADYKIDYYTASAGSNAVYWFGYFGEELDFVELFQALTSLTGEAWSNKDLTAYLDEDGRVCDFLLGNWYGDEEQLIGVRDGDDTTTNRLIKEHEAEPGAQFTGFGISAKSNSSGQIKYYTGTSNPAGRTRFYLTGYFKPAVAGLTLAPSPVTVTASVVAPTIARTNQYLKPSSITATATVQAPSMSGSGSAPLTPAPVPMVASVQAPNISGSGSTPLSPAPVTMSIAVVAPAIDRTNQYLIPAPVTVSITVQSPYISGSGSAPLSPSPVTMTLSVQAPAIARTNQYLIPSPVQVVASVVAPVISTPSGQSLVPAPVTMSATVQAPSISGSGSTPLSPSPVTMVLSVVAPVIVGSGSAPLSPSPVTMTASIQSPAIAGSGSAPMSPSPVAMVASIQAPAISGSGSAPLSPSPVVVVASVQNPSISGSGTATIIISPVAMVASVQAPSISVVTMQYLQPLPVLVVASVNAPSISGTGSTPLSPAALSVTAIVVAPQLRLVAFLVLSAYLGKREHNAILGIRDFESYLGNREHNAALGEREFESYLGERSHNAILKQRS